MTVSEISSILLRLDAIEKSVGRVLAKFDALEQAEMYAKVEDEIRIRLYDEVRLQVLRDLQDDPTVLNLPLNQPRPNQTRSAPDSDSDSADYTPPEPATHTPSAPRSPRWRSSKAPKGKGAEDLKTQPWGAWVQAAWAKHPQMSMGFVLLVIGMLTGTIPQLVVAAKALGVRGIDSATSTEVLPVPVAIPRAPMRRAPSDLTHNEEEG